VNFEDLDPNRIDAAKKLLADIGFGAASVVTLLQGGANNRAYQVADDGRRVLLKAYFRHAQDTRDRLGAEWAFLRFAWDHGIRTVPEPLAQDPHHALGVYQFIEGKPPTAPDVLQALHFFRALNRHKSAARYLLKGSESSFSIVGHLGLVGRRVQRLLEADLAADAAAFVREELAPAWGRITRRVYDSRFELDAELPPQDRCISPSDFGFHNAIQQPDGRLIFIDFEYAGWDDPAKLVGDFFSQPKVPVSMQFYDEFVNAVAPRLRPRIDLLLPVYRLKWCCILLNDLLPTSRARRVYALGTTDETTQLDKARLALQRIAGDFV